MTPAKRLENGFKEKITVSIMPDFEDKRLVFQKGKQKELVGYFRTKHHLSFKKLANLLDAGKTTVREYYAEKSNMRRSTFDKLLSFDSEAKKFELFIERQLPLNWGLVKGGVNRVKLITNKISYYARLRELKAQKEQKASGIYKQTIPMHPLISKLLEEDVDLHCILGACLLTDGSLYVDGNSYRINYATTDIELENILLSLLNVLSSGVPKVAYSNKGNQVRVGDANLGEYMLSLSPSYKTSPSWKYESKKEYLAGPQPTLKFLLNCNEQTKIWALRFAFSADGSISLPKDGKPKLELACYHPTLALEWKDFAEKLGLNCHLVKKSRSWCGLAGIQMQRRDMITKFHKLGGFLDGVKISRKSKRYCGMSKNTLLEKVVNSGQGGI